VKMGLESQERATPRVVSAHLLGGAGLLRDGTEEPHYRAGPVLDVVATAPCALESEPVAVRPNRDAVTSTNGVNVIAAS